MNIVFMGTPDFAVASLQALIDNDLRPVLCISQPDRPQGRKQIVEATPVKKLAEKYNIPVLQPTKLRTADFLATLQSYEPDLIVTAAYGRILPTAVLQAPKLGCINVHGSILPRYRGASPVQQAIINGDTETGITILRMTEDMDAGNIIKIAKMPITDEHTAQTLMADLAKLGGEILPDVVKAIADGTSKEAVQNHQEATYVKMLDRETGLIDFKIGARQVFNLIRGTYPWPGAYTEYKSKRLKIFKSHLVDLNDSKIKLNEADLTQAQDGEIILAAKGRLWVKIAGEILSLDELQLEGGKRLTAADCAHNFQTGIVLGAE